jgi:hypothetical protein
MGVPAPVSAWLFVAIAMASPALAQDPTCAGIAGQDTAARLPDVRLYASLRAAELRFVTAPRAQVHVYGCVPTDTIRVLRSNLPTPVEPGVTYRDVEITVEITTRVGVICGPLLHSLLERADTAVATRTAAANLRRICAFTPNPDSVRPQRLP